MAVQTAALASRLRRYVTERGSLSRAEWVALLKAPLTLPPPRDAVLFVSTTFDIQAGQLVVREEPAFR